MWLDSICLKNFRNYESQEIKFCPSLNIFLGENANGKTNILESIYFLALTRSHRTRTDKDLIHFDGDTLYISGILQKTTGTIPLEINITPKGRITKLNHLRQERLSDYVGTMNVILFSPEDLQLIKGPPSIRRNFMNMELGQMKPLYLSDLSSYHYILKQRNVYLKSSQKTDETFLSILDEQLVDNGARILRDRINFLKNLESYSQKKQKEISEGVEKIGIKYQSLISHNCYEIENLERAFSKSLLDNRKRDLFEGRTRIGPHRDDILFIINNTKASLSSQGQHRTLILSIKLSEVELMEKITNETPILLLDDVMSELDDNRQLKLLKTISRRIQTFITTTSLRNLQPLQKEAKIFSIKNGTIKEM